MQFIVGETTGNGEFNVSLQNSAFGFLLVGWTGGGVTGIKMSADNQQVVPNQGGTGFMDALKLDIGGWFRLASKHNQWYFSYPDTGIPGNKPVFLVVDEDFCDASYGSSQIAQAY